MRRLRSTRRDLSIPGSWRSADPSPRCRDGDRRAHVPGVVPECRRVLHERDVQPHERAARALESLSLGENPSCLRAVGLPRATRCTRAPPTLAPAHLPRSARARGAVAGPHRARPARADRGGPVRSARAIPKRRSARTGVRVPAARGACGTRTARAPRPCSPSSAPPRSKGTSRLDPRAAPDAAWSSARPAAALPFPASLALRATFSSPLRTAAIPRPRPSHCITRAVCGPAPRSRARPAGRTRGSAASGRASTREPAPSSLPCRCRCSCVP